ncbi:prepilin-type N-terminal cleavage/methylation domain-containing protein [Desulfonatronum parangueonense]
MTTARRNCNATRQTGLTLIELLIVLLIVSLGWFTLLPRLDPTAPRRADAPLHELNVFLDQVRHAAFFSGRFQEVRLDHVQGRFVWNEASHRMHQPVTRCTINAAPCPRTEALLRIYPAGYMDPLVLVFANGEQWRTSELDVRLLASERQ